MGKTNYAVEYIKSLIGVSAKGIGILISAALRGDPTATWRLLEFMDARREALEAIRENKGESDGGRHSRRRGGTE